MCSLALLTLTCTASCSAIPETVSPTQSPTESAASQVDCSLKHCVALTFDDGPDQFTQNLLDTLKPTNTPATFFLIGSKVQNFPSMVKRMEAEGHQVGSHTWDHADITTLSGLELKQQLERTDEAIKEVTGHSPSVFRPPLGHHDESHNEQVPYPVILWDTHSHDGRLKDSQKIIDAIMDTVHPGSIVLMHDTRNTTVQAVPELVSQLKAQGYTLVTIDQLFASELTNSVAYSSGPQVTGK